MAFDKLNVEMDSGLIDQGGSKIFRPGRSFRTAQTLNRTWSTT